jgi:HEAT repeat protein
LLQALSDKKPDVRWRAAEALGRIGASSSVVKTSLEGLLHDEFDYVSEAAQEALDLIGGD